MAEYLTTIGLEIHAQILTASKMFCGCSAAYAGAAPNSHTCPVCLGLPGSLPVINQHAVELAVLTGLAFNCRISPQSIIARKNYFYPDLPSGYQRSQYEEPLCTEGYVEIEGDDGELRRIGLTRIHIEEDTGKSLHADSRTSLIDFNRAGVPLMEIVSKPDIRSPEEAKRFFQKLRLTLMWLGVNTGNMEEGALRCDANVSVRPSTQKEYGAKIEIKNMNSFRAVERALIYEVSRQTGELEAGRTLFQETRGWVDTQGVTRAQRRKEFADDYRYFPEPDIPPLLLSEDWIAARGSELPELPDARCTRFMQQYGLSRQDAELLTSERAVANYFEAAVSAAPGQSAKQIANWITGEFFRLLNDTATPLAVAATRLQPGYIGELLELLAAQTINGATAKLAFEESFRSGEAPAAIVRARGWSQISDNAAIVALAREAIGANPKVVADYRAGKASAIKFLVGQVMKASRGQANPQLAQQILEQELPQA